MGPWACALWLVRPYIFHENSLLCLILGYWDFSYTACQFNGFLNSQLMLASILTLTMVSLHQYFTVVSKWSQSKLRRAANIMLIYVWFHSTALSVLPLTRITAYDLKRGRGQCSVKIPESAGEKVTASVYMISGFLIPLIIMSVSYYRIMKIVSKHARRVSQMSNSASVDRKAMQRQVTVTMIIVLIVFLICWSPFLVMSLFGAYVPILSNPTLANIAYLLGFANSCCNSIVLGTRNRTFTNEYLSILSRLKVLCPCFPNEEQGPKAVSSTLGMEASGLSVVYTNSNTIRVNSQKEV